MYSKFSIKTTYIRVMGCLATFVETHRKYTINFHGP